MGDRILMTIGTRKGLFVAEASSRRSKFELRGPFGQAGALQQDHVFFTISRQMISDGAADNASTDNKMLHRRFCHRTAPEFDTIKITQSNKRAIFLLIFVDLRLIPL